MTYLQFTACLLFAFLTPVVGFAEAPIEIESSFTRVGFAKVICKVSDAVINDSGQMVGKVEISVPFTGKDVKGSIQLDFPIHLAIGETMTCAGIFTGNDGKEHPFTCKVKRNGARVGVVDLRLSHGSRKLNFTSAYSVAGL